MVSTDTSGLRNDTKEDCISRAPEAGPECPGLVSERKASPIQGETCAPQAGGPVAEGQAEPRESAGEGACQNGKWVTK